MCLLGLGTIFTTSWRFGAKTPILQCFQWVRCALLEPLFLFNAIILHTFQDFERAVFKPFVQDVKGFLWNTDFIAFGGLTLIDWTSRHLLQSFNFKSFCVILSLRSVDLTTLCIHICICTERNTYMHIYMFIHTCHMICICVCVSVCGCTGGLNRITRRRMDFESRSRNGCCAAHG